MTNADVETVSWLRVVIAFLTLAGMMGLLAYGLKYIAMKGIKLPGVALQNKRLRIVESLPLDVKRRLVIVKRDDTEHLLLLGVNQDIVVESNLNAPPAKNTDTP